MWRTILRLTRAYISTNRSLGAETLLVPSVYQLTKCDDKLTANNFVHSAFARVYKTSVQYAVNFTISMYNVRGWLFSLKERAGCVENRCSDVGRLSCLSSISLAGSETRFSLVSQTNQEEQQSVSGASERGICSGWIPSRVPITAC